MKKTKIIKYGLMLVIFATLVGYQSSHTKTQPQDLSKKIYNTNEYSVISVNDGDTVVISNGLKKITIRLIGVDTPEVVDPRKPVQCFGREASENTKRILPSGTVISLELDSSQGEIDKYGRTLGYVILKDGINLNKKIIEDGFGHEYTYQNNKYKYQAEFKMAEKAAQEAARGLWNSSTCGGDTKQSVK